MVAEPHAFLSYTHADDDFHGGAISKLRLKLEQAVRAATGRPFTIFQDCDGIAFGQQWQDRLDEALGQARFLIPILTPSYFESTPCRDEFKKFLWLEAQAQRKDLILPLLYLDTWQLEDEDHLAADPLAREIKRRQWRDWRDWADIDPDDARVRPALKKLAGEIGTALRQRVAGPAKVQALRQPPSPVGKAPATPAIRRMTSEQEWPAGHIFRDVDVPWCPEMVVIPAGSFLMGSPESEAGRSKDEGPQHEVRIAQPFALGRYPITRNEFAAFIEAIGHGDAGWREPGFVQSSRDPVVNVSWHDAKAYVAWLGERTGKPYRLPSEAEWEYAARAGTTTPFWTGATISTEQANYDGNHTYGSGRKGVYRQRTVPVDDPGFPANPFGLYHVHGNVWEWCEDLWHGNYDGAPVDGSAWLKGGEPPRRVLRGGSWYNEPRNLRSANRGRTGPGNRSFNAGFRVARMVTP